MAVIKKDGGNMALPIAIKRGNPIALDTTSVWYSKTDMENYAKTGATAYVGQYLVYVNETDNIVEAYVIANKAGTLLKLSTTTASGNLAADVETLKTQVADLLARITPLEEAAKIIPTLEATEYGIEKLETSTEGSVATYQLYKTTDKGTTKTYLESRIEVPLDLVVKSGSVETYTDETAPTVDGKKLAAGTYIVLVIANAKQDKLYIPASGLVDIYTTGSTDTDQVIISIDKDRKVTAALHSSVTESLAKANTALQPSDIEIGKDNGTIKVRGADVPVKGLGDAAYTTVASIEGKIDTAKNAVIGNTKDASTADTIFGAKKYADEAVKANRDVKITDADVDAAAGIAQSKIAGLTDALDARQTTDEADDKYVAKDGYVAYSTAEKTKLAGIETSAQVNKIEVVKDAEGTALTITDKAIKLPVATALKAGLVKPGAEFNIGADGALSIKELNVTKLVQSDADKLILDCGTSIR